MDWLTFFTYMAEYTAWPLSALFISIIFRKDIRALLAKLKKGKLLSAELEFENDVQALADSSSPEGAARSEPSAAASLIAAQNPRALILGSWAEIDAMIRNFAHMRVNRLAVPLPGAKGTPTLVRALEVQKAISPETGALYRDLKSLRNQAAHDPDFNPSAESVLEFTRLVQELRAKLSLDLELQEPSSPK